MKTSKLKTATQVTLEFKREELKDIKATAKRAQSQLKKDVATLRYEIKLLRTNVKTDNTNFKIAAAKIKAEKKAARIDAIQAKLDALKNPIGIHAKKAAKKPSKVTIVNPAAALIAVMNKKAA